MGAGGGSACGDAIGGTVPGTTGSTGDTGSELFGFEGGTDAGGASGAPVSGACARAAVAVPSVAIAAATIIIIVGRFMTDPSRFVSLSSRAGRPTPNARAIRLRSVTLCGTL